MPDLFDTLEETATATSRRPPADVFDEIAPPDIFDEIEAPAGVAPAMLQTQEQATATGRIQMAPDQAPVVAAGMKPGRDYNVWRDVFVDAPRELAQGVPASVETTAGAINIMGEAAADQVTGIRRNLRAMAFNPEHPVAQILNKLGIVKGKEPPEPAIFEKTPEANERLSNWFTRNAADWTRWAETGIEAGDASLQKGGFTENPSFARVVRGFSRSSFPMAVAVGSTLAGAPNLGTAFMTAVEAAPEYQRAKEAGLTEQQALASATLSGLGTFVLERAGMEGIVGTSPAVQRAIKKLGGSWLAGAAVATAAESGTEGLQQIWQNAVAQGYDENRKAFEGVLDSVLSGGLGGFVFYGGARAKAKYDAVPPATPAEVVAQAKQTFGENAVTQPNDRTVVVKTPAGRTLVYQFVGSSEDIQLAPESFYESTAASNPRAAEQAMRQANGDKAAAGKILQESFGAVGGTRGVLWVTDQETGEKLDANVLAQLVTGQATIGDLAEEDFHALMILTKGRGKMTSQQEENLARALREGTDHPLVQRMKNRAAKLLKVFGKSGETAFETAARLQEQMRTQATAVPAEAAPGRTTYNPFESALGPIPTVQPEVQTSAERGDTDAIRERGAETMGEQLGGPEGPWQEEAGGVQPGLEGAQPAGAEGIEGPAGAPAYGAVEAEQAASVRKKTHQTAERVAAAELLGSPLSERLLQDEAVRFVPQRLKDIAERAAATPDPEIEARVAVLDAIGAEDSVANDLGALLVEKINRQREAGDMDGAYQSVIRASKNFGAVGQILRQAAMLKTSTPEGMAMVSEALADKAGRKISAAERGRLVEAAGKDIVARRGVEAAEEAFLTSPSKTTATALDSARQAAEKANRTFVNTTTSVTPKSWADIVKQTMQGGVLTPLSEVANIVGNIVNNPLRGTAQSIAATAEGVLKLVGAVKRRTVGQPLPDVGAYMKGVGMGLVQAPETIITGASRARTKAGGEVDVSTGFQPARAWVRQVSGEKLSANERAKLLVEGTLGVVPTMMLRPLQAMDNPFYFGAYYETLREIGRLKVANGELAEADLQRWLKVPDKQALELADERAREAVYQGGEGLLVNAMNTLAGLGARRIGRWTPTDATKLANAVAWRPIMLFAQTPGNILQEGNKFLNPVYDAVMMGRAIQQSRAARGRGDVSTADKFQRSAFMSLGYMSVSLMLYSAATALARAGLLTPRAKNKKERELTDISVKGNRLNWSGLRRLVRREDPAYRAGDKMVDYRNFGYLGMALNIVANGLDDVWKESMKTGVPFDAKSASGLEIAKGVFPALGSALLDLAMMKGSYNLLRAVSDGNYDSWLASYFETVSSVALPNAAKAANRITIDYMPETRSDAERRAGEILRESTIRTIANQVKAKALYVPNVTPLWTKGIPLKQDAFGRPIPNTPPGRTPWIYHLLDVTKTEEVPDDPVALELYRLYRATGSTEVGPSEPPRQFRPPGTTKATAPGRFLSDPEHAKYKQIVGWMRYSALNEFMSTGGWVLLDDASKVKAVRQINDVMLDSAYLPMRNYLLQQNAP